MAKQRAAGPTKCLDDNPSSKSIRLGGRFINLMRLAERGLDHGYLSRILSGERVPSVPYAMKLATELGILTDNNEPDIARLFMLIRDRGASRKSANRR